MPSPRRDDQGAEFAEFYLREIGVHTPVSLSSFEAPQTEAVHAEQPAVPVHQTHASGSSQPVCPRTLDDVAAQAATCRLCSLADTRTQVVFGSGNPHADLVFIGEAPGQEEDKQGEPFVGRAGQLLDRMLAATGLDRESVYIMNTIKCRPPNNRDPKPDEVQACQLWFERQLELLQPKVICLLGRVAAQTVLETDSPLGSLRGRWHNYQGIPVLVTYHPAFLLRSPTQKQKSWQDLLTVQECLNHL